jgi:hypothetical protein
MFNKSLFNKTNFERITQSKEKPRMLSSGGILVEPVMHIPVPISDISSEGGMEVSPIIEVEHSGELGGVGGVVADGYANVLELSIYIGGMGEIAPPELGNLEVKVIDLQEISLGAFETVTIDTDLMVILFGQEHDVSSLTMESEFFQLGVGANRLKFVWSYAGGVPPSPLPPNELSVTTIWQNRWL